MKKKIVIGMGTLRTGALWGRAFGKGSFLGQDAIPGSVLGELVLAVLGGPHGMAGIEPRSAECKVNALPAVLPLRPWERQRLYALLLRFPRPLGLVPTTVAM